jgi:hypothetical protein
MLSVVFNAYNMLSVIMLNVILLSVIKLSIIMLNVIMLNVVYSECRAPLVFLSIGELKKLSQPGSLNVLSISLPTLAYPA